MNMIDDLFFCTQELRSLNDRLNALGLEVRLQPIERRGRKASLPVLERKTRAYNKDSFSAGPRKYWSIIRDIKTANNCSTAEAKKVYEANPDRYLGHSSRSKSVAKPEEVGTTKQRKPYKLRLENKTATPKPSRVAEATREFWNTIRKIASDRNISNREALAIYKANKRENQEETQAENGQQSKREPHKLSAYWNRVRSIAKKEGITLAAARLRLKEM